MKTNSGLDDGVYTMTDEKIQRTIDVLSVVQGAASSMYSELLQGHKDLFLEMATKLDIILEKLEKDAEEQEQQVKGLRLGKAAISVQASLRRICRYSLYNIPLAIRKTEYELIPFVNDMYAEYYFWTCIFPFREKWDDYYKNEMPLLMGNPYVRDSREKGNYKYDLSICVLSYNKLDYTKRCIDYLIRFMPRNLKCELILTNNGSSDGTKEYFDSIMPTKQLDIRENWAFCRGPERIVEGEFYLAVSNDVLVMPHAIENMLRLMKEDSKVGLVVPATPNISNYQAESRNFNDWGEMETWAEKNNVYDPCRHEVRTRLMNPIEMGRSDYMTESMANGYHLSDISNAYSFPDDIIAVLCRRKGYKMILAKDAYCYHYGSVTIKDDEAKNQTSDEERRELYFRGKKKFEEMFGIDPWGTGFCYDIIFRNVELKFDGHIEVLGLNTGIGANPLKIREQYKEIKRNTDVTLTYYEQDEKFFEEVKAYADETAMVRSIDDVLKHTGDKRYHYIVFEEPFRQSKGGMRELERLADILVPNGEIYLAANGYIKCKRFECIVPKLEEGRSKFVQLIKK